MTYETKADAIETVFDTAAASDNGAEITALRAEMARLSSLVTARAVARPALAGTKADAAKPDIAETWLRHGTLPGDGIKAASIGVGPKGGVAVPVEIDTVIDRVLRSASPIRSLATVRTISSGTYKKAFSTTGPASGWVGDRIGWQLRWAQGREDARPGDARPIRSGSASLSWALDPALAVEAAYDYSTSRTLATGGFQRGIARLSLRYRH